MSDRFAPESLNSVLIMRLLLSIIVVATLGFQACSQVVEVNYY